MQNAADLKTTLNSMKLYDSPLAKIHPYWARKPLNVVAKLIDSFSDEGDVVVDPFMGCGTSLLAGLVERRNVVGSDINPLASLIVQGTLCLYQEPAIKLKALKEFVKAVEESVNNWFVYPNVGIIERERFTVVGEFANGNYELIPSEVVVKSNVGIGHKRVVISENIIHTNHDFGVALNSPIDFKTKKLMENSRIAIPTGVNLSHYFTQKNIATINTSLRLIDTFTDDPEIKMLLKFFISSTLPLLRLSDYKASSQWPYWRPKERLTSRNPVNVMKRRLREFELAQNWLLENVASFVVGDTSSVSVKKHKLHATIGTFPVQELRKRVGVNYADLVITDPPYADHVPYLEYSSMWSSILGLPVTKSDFSNEIVKTDAKARKSDNSKYIERLLLGFEGCASILKNDGYFIWYYQDSNLKHWAELYTKSKQLNLELVNLIPMPKQRRSMKTVTAPGKTFDGDLILIFKKTETVSKEQSDKKTKEAEIVDVLENINSLPQPFFFRYATLVQKGFEQGWLVNLSEQYSDIRQIVR